jgi:pyruvate dehydrogenase E1 component
MAMVLRANKHTNVGGHIASFASAATLYDVGFNHFWHAPSERTAAISSSSRVIPATGVYARAFMLVGSPPNSSTISGSESTAAASRRIRIRG